MANVVLAGFRIAASSFLLSNRILVDGFIEVFIRFI